MRLKPFVSAALLLAVGLLLCYPWVLRLRPHAAAPRREFEAYEAVFIGYNGATICLFMACGAMAALLLRQERERFEREARENLRGLVEGSLSDLKERER